VPLNHTAVEGAGFDTHFAFDYSDSATISTSLMVFEAALQNSAFH
jgi:hypothetical protein